MKIKNKSILLVFILTFAIALSLSACAPGGTDQARNMPGAPDQGNNLLGDNNQNDGRYDMNLQGVTPGVGQKDINPGRALVDTPAPGRYDMQTPGRDRDIVDNNNMADNNNIADNNNMGDNNNRAQKIEAQLKQMKELKEADVLVVGNTAVVGCNRSNNAPDANAAKNMIISRVKQMDPSITNVVVSESADITARIRQMAKDMGNRPMNQMDDQVNQLIKEIAPKTNAS